MISKYINVEANRIEKTELMKDIRDGRISKIGIESFINELDSLITKNQLNNPYLGQFFKKEKKTNWTKYYFERELFSRCVSNEIFTKDFLFYSSEVASYVNGKPKRFFIKMLCVVICCVICFFIGTTKNNANSKEKSLELENSIVDLQNQITKLTDENKLLKDKNTEFSVIIEKFTKLAEESSTVIQNKIEDDLDRYINNALNGQNMKATFNNQNQYTSLDVEKRALERGLTKIQAQKLIDNLANPNKFDINKFSE